MRSLLTLVLAIGVTGCGDDSLNGGEDMTGGAGDMAMVVGDGGGGDGMVNTNCDPVKQTGCNTGEKCALTIVGSGMNQTLGQKCEPDGTVALGDMCMRMMGTIDSNCAGNGYCSRTGAAMTICHKMCGKDGDCASSEKCLGLTDKIGYCVTSCIPGGAGCSGGLDCSTPEAGIGSTQMNIVNPFWTCRVAGTGAAYTDCMRSSQCGPQMICDQNNGWCAPLCDLSGNPACPQPPNQDGGMGVGVSCQELATGLVPGACQ